MWTTTKQFEKKKQVITLISWPHGEINENDAKMKNILSWFY